MNKPKAGMPCVICGHPAEMHFSCEIGSFCKACDPNVPDTFKWEHMYRSEASSPAAPADSAEELARGIHEYHCHCLTSHDCDVEIEHLAALLRSRMGEPTMMWGWTIDEIKSALRQFQMKHPGMSPLEVEGTRSAKKGQR